MNQLRVVVLGSTVLAIVGAVLAVIAGSPVALPTALFQGVTACVSYNVPGKQDGTFTAPISNTTADVVRLRSVVPTRLVGLTKVEEWIIENPTGTAKAGTTVWNSVDEIPGWSSRHSVDGATVAAHSHVLLVVSGTLTSAAESGYAQDFVTTVYGPLGTLRTGAKDSGGFGLVAHAKAECVAA